MSNNGEDSGKAVIGCVIVLLLIFLIPLLIELLKVLMIVAVIGGIGYLLYQIKLYNDRTGNVTQWFEDTFNIQREEQQLAPPAEEPKPALPQPDPQDNILQQLDEVKSEMDRLKLENQSLKEGQKEVAKEALRQYSDQIDRRNKQHLLDDFFGNESGKYSRSDEFEKQQFQDEVKKKREELDMREFKQDVNEKLLDQDRDILGVKTEMQEGFNRLSEKIMQIEQRMLQMDAEFNEKILRLAMEITSVKAYFEEKFSRLEVLFHQEIANVKELIGRLRVELKQDISDTRLQFGKEIVRIDKQQNMIVGKLAEYEAKIKGFTYEVMRIKNEAHSFALRGQDMFNRANTLYQHHKAEIRVLSNEMQTGMQQIALHKTDFANSVGRAKLMMDKISQDQYFALKDMAYERIGIEALRQDYDQRSNLQNQKMQNLIQEKRHLEQTIRDQISRGNEVTGLQHQLNMTKENLRYASNRASLLQQEAAMVRRLGGNKS